MRFSSWFLSLCVLLVCKMAASQVANVNLNTGQVNFSTEIANVRSHNINLPISLNYDSRITARDRSNWVGIGFDLDVPYIERTVVAGPDDLTGHSLVYSDLPASKLDTLKILYPNETQRDTIRNLHFELLSYIPLVYKTRLSNNSVVFGNGLQRPDTLSVCHEVNGSGGVYALDPDCPGYYNQAQQDQYYTHNFPKGDRRLFFSGWYPRLANATHSRADSLTVACDPYAPWKIDYLIDPPAAVGSKNGEISTWIIRDQDGIRYYFDRRVRMSPTRDFDAARVVYSRVTPEDSINQGDFRPHLTLLAKHNATTCVRWYLTRMIHPSGDSIAIQYNSLASRRIDENPYYADIEKFDLTAPESGKVADTLIRVTDSTILAGDSLLGLPRDNDWPEVPKARLDLTIRIRDFVVGRKLEPAMFYTFAPDTVRRSDSSIIFKRSDLWGYFYDFPTAAQNFSDSIRTVDKNFDSTIAPQLIKMHTDSSNNAWIQVVIHFWDEGIRKEMPPLVFRTSFDPSRYDVTNELDSNYGGSNKHWLWEPGGTDDDNNFLNPITKRYSIGDLLAHQGEHPNSYIVFEKTLEFRNAISIRAIEVSFQGVNRNWEWVSYHNPNVLFNEDCVKYIGRGGRLSVTSAINDIRWHTRMMGLRFAPSSDWTISGASVEDYVPMFQCAAAFVAAPWSQAPWAPAKVPATDTIFASYNTHDEGSSIQKADGTIDDYYVLYKYQNVLLSRKKHQFRQLVLRDDSRTVLDCAWPRRITTPLREIEFVTATGTEADAWGRPRLTSVVTKDRINAEQLGKVSFTYGPSPLTGNFQLQEIFEQKAYSGPHRQLYGFEYKTDDGLGTDVGFGNRHKGMVKAITDLYGGRNEYTYEPGYFRFLSDGSSNFESPVRNGFRVKKITQTGSNVARPIVSTISYDSGEVAYGLGFTIAPYETQPTFLDYAEMMSMTDYQVRYGRAVVTVQGQGGGTVYRYSIAANTPELVDERDEYHIRENRRHKLIENTKYRGSSPTSKIASTKYRYSIVPPGFATFGDQDDGLFVNEARFRFSKPETDMGVFGLRRTSGSAYELRERDRSYYQFIKSSLPRANIVHSEILAVGTEITMKDGVTRRTYRAVNKKGQDSLVIEFEDTSASAEGIAVKKEYAYQKDLDPTNLSLGAGNILSPIGVFTVERVKDGKSTALSQDITHWLWQGTRGAQVHRGYTWHEARSDSGIPVSASYSNFNFLNWQPKPGYEEKWLWNARTVVYTKRGKPWMTYLPYVNKYEPYGNPTTLNIYRDDSELQIGTVVYMNVSKSSYREASVFTCDYHTDSDTRYWDKLNCWERGWTNPPTLSDTTPFGGKSIYVVNDYAAGRNCRVFPGKSYTLSAWVKVDSGKLFLGSAYYYAKSGYEHTWPIDSLIGTGYQPDSVSMTAAQCGGQWKLMQMTIPASRTLPFDTNKTWFAQVFVGKGQFATSTGVKAYVDDIRFYPSDALVSTVHYDSRNRAVCAIDANNSARYVEYDKWDRPVAEKDSERRTIRSQEHYVYGEHYWQASDKYRILTPNGGEILRVGDQCRIVWQSSDDAPPNASVFISYDAGLNYGDPLNATPIGRRDSEWGDFTWTVALPAGVSGSGECLIMVKDEHDNTDYDVSDDFFSIVPQDGGNRPPTMPCNGVGLPKTGHPGWSTLNWQCGVDPDGDDVMYLYEIYRVNGTLIRTGSTFNTTLDVSLPTGSYIWRIKAEDDEHGTQSSWSISWPLVVM